MEAKKGKLLANPNCTTAIALMALWPLYKEFGLKKVIMSTYQAASGAGAPGMNELKDGVEAYVKGDDVTNDVFAHPLPFNVIPHIDVFQDNMWAAFPLVLIRRIPCPAFSLARLRFLHSAALSGRATRQVPQRQCVRRPVPQG